ncbi:MAG: hypothetical protein ABIJ23_03550 [Candidatus Magasanikbacteria bacterium]
MKYSNLFIFCLILALSLVLVPKVLAQTDDSIASEAVVPTPVLYDNVGEGVDGEAQDDGVMVQPILIESGNEVTAEGEPIIIGGWDSLADQEDIGYIDVELEEINKIPSGFGLWMRGFKERVAVVFTFDPVKKAEKQTRFAAERVHLAEYMLENSDDEKVQLRAEKVMEKAHRLVEKVEVKKEKWLERANGEKEKMLKNIATLQIRKEYTLDLLEEKIPEEKQEGLKKLREEGLKINERLVNVLENENISDEIKQHLQNVKDRIEAHAEEVKQFRDKKMELLQATKEGVEGAKIQLQELKQDKKEELEMVRMQYKENQEALKAAAEAGDEDAQNKLQIIKREQLRKQEMEKSGIPMPAKVQLDESSEGVFSPGGFGTAPKQPIKIQAETEGEWKVEEGGVVSGSGQTEEPPMETVQAEVLPKVEAVPVKPTEVKPLQKQSGKNF